MARGTGAHKTASATARSTRASTTSPEPAANAPKRRGGRRPRPLSAVDMGCIAAEYSAGAGFAELTRRYRISHERAAAVVVALGGTIRPRGTAAKPIDNELLATMIREYEQECLGTAAIAARHQLDPNRIRKLLADAGVELRQYVLNSAAALSPEERAALACDYRAGATLNQLKAKYHCGMPTVRAALDKHGVAIRPRSKWPTREETEAAREK